MSDFNKYSNYTEESSFSSVVFGSNRPLLEVELNEVQQIINSKLNKIMKALGVKILFLSDPTYSDGVLTIDSALVFEEDVKARRSLEYAVDYLNILKTATFHRAGEDAMYTMQVMQKMSYSDMERYYSIDTFQRPKNRKSEVYAIFEKYSKYISKEFSSKEEAMADREVASTRC